MRNAVTAFIVALLIAPVGVSAQGTPSTSCVSCSVDRFAAQVPSRDLLRKAAFREASRLADTLAFAPRQQQFQQQSRQRSWAGQHPVLLGTLVGAGIGVGYGAITPGPACEYEFPCKSIFGLLGGVFGGAVGFIVGLR